MGLREVLREKRLARIQNRRCNGSKGSKGHKGRESRQSPLRGVVTPRQGSSPPDD